LGNSNWEKSLETFQLNSEASKGENYFYKFKLFLLNFNQISLFFVPFYSPF